MKIFITLSFAFTTCALATAQNIPDSTFAQAIRDSCPACIDANNQLTQAADTLTSLIVATPQIYDLSGLEYFRSLQTLDIRYGEFSVLPALPYSLKSLTCAFGQLNQISNLPNRLKYINLSYNQLTDLPPLPDELNYLDVSNNALTHLSYRFSDSLTELNVSGNLFRNFSILGGRRLKTLYADGCQIERVSSLPANLTFLQMNFNRLSTLPDLPLSIQEFNFADNYIAYTSELVNLINLERFSLEGNNLVLLPDLPPNLQHFNVSRNRLTALPNFPQRLRGAYFVNNQVAEWPVLNDSLTSFYASYNLLSEVPRYLPNLYLLAIDFNTEIACLEYMPPCLIYLNARGTNIQCVPNFTPPMTGYPLPICNSANNSNNCDIISAIHNSPAATFTISPNPCQNYLTVQNSDLLDDNSQLFLYNNLGQLVKQQRLFSNNENIDVSALQPAVYYLTIKTSKGSFSQKVVKN